MSYLQSKHTTKEGATMLISQMETSHLLNTVRFALRKVVEAVPVVEPTDENKVKNALYGKNDFDPKTSAEIIDQSIFRLSPYIVELFFRTGEINRNPELSKTRLEIINQLKLVFMRDGKLEGFPVKTLVSLPERTFDDEDEDDENDLDSLIIEND